MAADKIIHAGITEARAIVSGNKPVKFGMKWLIHRLNGGCLFGQRVQPYASENQMPEESLKDYRALFGAAATPKMVVYDRGASLPAAAARRQPEGVQPVGMPPPGRGAGLVGKQQQQQVNRERRRTEGRIGRLKSRQYGFSHRPERRLQTQEAVGQRAIVSVNLTTLMRDLVEQAKAASLAPG